MPPKPKELCPTCSIYSERQLRNWKRIGPQGRGPSRGSGSPRQLPPCTVSLARKSPLGPRHGAVVGIRSAVWSGPPTPGLSETSATRGASPDRPALTFLLPQGEVLLEPLIPVLVQLEEAALL